MSVKSDKKKKSPAAERGHSFWASLYQPGMLMMMALLCSSPIVYGYVLKHLPADETFPEFMVQENQITVVKQPEYIPPYLVQQILERAGIKTPVSIHTSGLAQTLQVAASEHPWVLSADKVELIPTRGIKFHLTFRQPVAMIKTGSGFYPLDREGILLPPRDFDAEAVKKYPLISNVQTLPQGPEGTHWGDLTVTGAARLAEFLHPPVGIITESSKTSTSDYWTGMQLEEIIIPPLTKAVVQLEEIDYQIKVRGGSVLNWGVAPGVNTTKQPGPEQKLLRMLKYFQEFGSFTAPRGPYEIDFRSWSETYRRPL